MYSLDLLEGLKFIQGCQRQVVAFMHAWSKKVGDAGKMYSFCTKDKDLVAALMDARGQAESVSRYDFAENNLDTSINEFYLDKGQVASAVVPPVMLVFKQDKEDRREYVVVHVIYDQLAFISASSEDVAREFLTGLVSLADKPELPNTEEGFSFNTGGD